MSAHVLTTVEAKRKGAYYTPERVADALVRYAVRAPTDRLLDPACGDGRFISFHANSVGVERDCAAATMARERAPRAEVHCRDFFDWAENTGERFDCAVGNPPFIRYQLFSGETRKRALQLCLKLGVSFSGLTTSWAPFLVAATSLLRSGGRIAFVVPASIGHAPFAVPLINYLVGRFNEVRIVAIRRKLFPQLSEDCWLLFAEGFGGATNHIQLDAVEEFEDTLEPCNPKLVLVKECVNEWNGRIRPYLLTDTQRSLYLEATRSERYFRLADVASVGIGYITGDNDYFHLRPSDIERWRIPLRYLHPTVRNSRALRGTVLTTDAFDEWCLFDQPVFLLNIAKDADLTPQVQNYLDSSRGFAARETYKCRNRKPWYSVPDVRVPAFFLSYMSGAEPQLVRNQAAVSCTNTLHAVHMHREEDAETLNNGWQSLCRKLSCEIEGHPLGGGLLKLEPTEASRILLTTSDDLPSGVKLEVRSAIRTLRSWRHYEQES